MKEYKILIINPGSTSDEVGYYEGNREIFHEVMRYETKDLLPYEGKKVTEQFSFRKEFVLTELKNHNVNLKELDAVVARGGLLKPMAGGLYEVNERMKMDLREEVYGSHPSNLGALIADSIASEISKKAYIADPVTVDEMMDIARYSGMVENPRISIFHCLNQRRVGYLIAKQLNKDYNKLNLIIAHLGGGMSAGAHLGGRVVDVNNALDGEGPFTPQRSGGVPSGGLLKLAFSGKHSFSDLKLLVKGKGGMVAYTGTSDLKVLEKFALREPLSEEEKKTIKSDLTSEDVCRLIDAMAYQISKEICSLSAVFCGKVDAIVLTGGLAYSEFIMDKIKNRTEWLCPVYVVPGGYEIIALKEACERVLDGEEDCKEYT